MERQWLHPGVGFPLKYPGGYHRMSTTDPARAPRTAPLRRLTALWRATLAVILVLGGAGAALTAGGAAASAAPGDPTSYPYNITFVWQLGPNSAPGSQFDEPQTLVATGSDPADPRFVPDYDLGCGNIYQIDRYRITNDEDQALIDRLRAEGVLTSQEDNGIGGQWETEYGETFFYYQYGDTECGAMPVAPVVEQAVCTAPGQASDPTVTLPQTVGIDYRLDGEVVAGGTLTVTASPQKGYVLEPTDGWTPQGDGTATLEIELADVDCTVTAIPVAPAVTPAECVPGGAPTAPVVTPAETPGIDYTLDGDVVAGGTVTVTATPQAGFEIGAGADWVPNDDGTATLTIALGTPECEKPQPPPVPENPAGPPAPPGPPAPGRPVDRLPQTGADPAGFAGAAGVALLLAGAATVAVARRRVNG